MSGALLADLRRPHRGHEQASLALRLRVWLRRRELDRALAAGAPIDSDELAHRAAQLTSPAGREAIAAMLANVLDAAEELPPPGGPDMPSLNRPAVLDARGHLLALIERLRGDEPAGYRGVAQAQQLATDPRGVLYRSTPVRVVVAAVELVLLALDEAA